MNIKKQSFLNFHLGNKKIIFGILIISMFILSSCDQLITAPGQVCLEDNVRVILVTDWSGTMYDYRNEVKDVLKQFSGIVVGNPSNLVGLVMFNINVEYYTPVNENNKIVDFVNGLNAPVSKTCLSCGLARAYSLLSTLDNKRNIVVVLSDGNPNRCIGTGDDSIACTSITAKDQTRQIAKKLVDDKNAKIYSLAYESTDPLAFPLMEELANMGNGKVYSNALADLDGVYGDVVNRICFELCDTTVPEYCERDTRECRGQEVWQCKDSDDDDTCGDYWEREKTCTGNYECKNGDCVCKTSITCSNGKKHNERWCTGNKIERCDVNQATCTATIVTEQTCNSPQVCDASTTTCKCIDECTVGEKEKVTTVSYRECISNSPCNTWQTKNCPTGQEFDGYTNTCECTETLDSCNEAYLYNTVRCIDSDSRETCSEISGSNGCYEYTFLDNNQYPSTRECVAGDYQCKADVCTHNDCSGDGQQYRICSATSDPKCPTYNIWKACQPDYKCSTTTWKCEPQHQCDKNNPLNGMYMRCNPLDDREIQECVKGSDGVYRWATTSPLTCGVGEICTSGSDAYCTDAYRVSISSNDIYPVGMPITDVVVNIASNDLSVSNVVVIACVESEELGCTDDQKMAGGLVQIRTDINGNTPKMQFEGAPKTGTWYVSAYVKDYKESTVESKPIYIKKRIDLDVNAPATAFINTDVKITYRAEDVDTGQVLVPSVDIFLDKGGVNVPFTHTSVNEFSFNINSIGTIHYRVIGSYPGYLEDTEEGYIEMIHPGIDTEIMVAGVDIRDLVENKIDTGNKEIKITVRRGATNLKIDTSNLMLRNPAQAIGEGTVLNFYRDANDVYTANYNFQESGKTYFLEGIYTLIDTGEVVAIEQAITTKGRPDEEPIFDPLILFGAALIFVAVIVISIILIRRRK